MLFPFRDDNPTLRQPVATVGLIVANVLVFLFQLSLPGAAGERFIYAYGMIPAVLFGEAQLAPSVAAVPPWFTIFSSMFLHGSIMHIAGNMLFLWVFGNNIEDAMGHARFVVFYLVCGIAAALAQAMIDPDSTVPMVGASGAISGVLGAYLVLHPYAHVHSLLFLGFFVRVITLPAMIVLGLWFVLQVINAMVVETEGGGVAFMAHVGGFIAGAVLVPLFRERRVVRWGGRKRRGPWG